jgi:nicotinate-nucleotide adenylyltransferase
VATIALFGGSFDPPHLGHLYAALHARAVGRADAVWVLPSARHPYAKDLRPWEQRWELCQLAFADLPFVELHDDERHSSGYTVDLVELLMRNHPGNDWMLVGGTDTAMDLPNWHRGDDLAKLIRVHAVPRGGHDGHPGALPAISSSLVRGYLATGRPTDHLLAPPVAKLIHEHGWYTAT